jgi:hypothetical protein
VATTLRRPERQDISKALVIVASSDQTRRVADRCLAAIKEVVQHPGVLKMQTKDSLLFQRMLLLAIVPAAVAKDAPAEVKKAFYKQVSETVAALGMSKVPGFKWRVHKATIVGMKNITNPTSAVLLNVMKPGAHCCFTPQLIAEIRAWVLFCDKVIKSPNVSDSIVVKCPITGEKKKERKCFYMFSV